MGRTDWQAERREPRAVQPGKEAFLLSEPFATLGSLLVQRLTIDAARQHRAGLRADGRPQQGRVTGCPRRAVRQGLREAAARPLAFTGHAGAVLSRPSPVLPWLHHKAPAAKSAALSSITMPMAPRAGRIPLRSASSASAASL